MGKNWGELDIDAKLKYVGGKLGGGLRDGKNLELSCTLLGVPVEKYFGLSSPKRGLVVHLHTILDKLKELTDQYVYLRTRLEPQQDDRLTILLETDLITENNYFIHEDLYIGHATEVATVAGITFQPGDTLIRASGDYWLRMGGEKGFYNGRFLLDEESVPVLDFTLAAQELVDEKFTVFSPFLTPEKACHTRAN